MIRVFFQYRARCTIGMVWRGLLDSRRRSGRHSISRDNMLWSLCDYAVTGVCHDVSYRDTRALSGVTGLVWDCRFVVPHSPTVPQSHSPTVPQSHSPTVPQSHSATVLQSHGPTVPRSYRPTKRLTCVLLRTEHG